MKTQGVIPLLTCMSPPIPHLTAVPPPSNPVSQEFIYTSLADPLIQFVAANKANTDGTTQSLYVNIVLGSDYYDAQANIMAADYGFQGYMGVPGLNSTDEASRQAAYANDVAWGE